MSPIRPVPTSGSVNSWANKNVGLVAMSYIYSCEAEGYQTCPMEGYDSIRIKELLNIPERYEVAMAVATGKGEGGGGTERYDFGEVFFNGTFGEEIDV